MDENTRKALQEIHDVAFYAIGEDHAKQAAALEDVVYRVIKILSATHTAEGGHND